MRKFILLFFILPCAINLQAQIKVSSSGGTYDSITSGTPIYYQFSWDDPLDEFPEYLKLPKIFKAFETPFDTFGVGDGFLLFTAAGNANLLYVDASGWDLADKGNVDTLSYPNWSPVMVGADGDEVEWRRFGFYEEYDSLHEMPSTGTLKMKVDGNSVHMIYGDFAMVRPDLAFEGFGSLHPAVTLIDANDSFSTWFIYGNPENPSISDQVLDSAFDHLPPIGQDIKLDFSKTNSLAKVAKMKLGMSPNPTKDVVYFTGGKDYSGSRFQIITMDGKTAKQGVLEQNQISIGDLPTGTYVIRLSGSQGVMFGKLIKTD